MENVEINITPMSLKNGVMGLPIQCCRNWDASGSVEGIFQYAGRKSSITFSPKHKNKERGTAAAWQFTVNDSIQFNQLRISWMIRYLKGQSRNMHCISTWMKRVCWGIKYETAR